MIVKEDNTVWNSGFLNKVNQEQAIVLVNNFIINAVTFYPKMNAITLFVHIPEATTGTTTLYNFDIDFTIEEPDIDFLECLSSIDSVSSALKSFMLTYHNRPRENSIRKSTKLMALILGY